MNAVKPQHVMIVAGETSGDIHAASLVRAIRAIAPETVFSGLGGRFLADQGVHLYADLTTSAVIGFAEVLKHFKRIKKLFHLFLEQADTVRPDAVILVDYPGFNLRLAKELKKRGIKVIYYVSPQVWAWKEKRVELIKQTVCRMIVFFEFEKDFYAKHGFAADCVGHPLIDQIRVTASRHDLLKTNGLPDNARTIGLFPGSRIKEVETLLPRMLDAARIIFEKHPEAQFLLAKAKNLDAELITQHLRGRQIPVTVIDSQFHNCINACDICIAASGTATLETAVLEKPMVIVYRTAWLTHLLIRSFIRIPWIGLPNIIAQKEIVPECIQENADSAVIARRLLALYDDPFKMETTINALKDVRKKLGGPGASRRAAEIIVEEIRREGYK
jgi:lipid-A-disaccharide synthase